MKTLKDERNQLIDRMDVIVFCLVMLFCQFFSFVKVHGESMVPTYEEGNLLMIQKHFTSLERHDVVVFHSNYNDKYLIKRIIGMPSETINVSDGYVYVNGERILEDYILEPYTSGDFSGIIPEGSYFVLGDNRQNSADSRTPQIGFMTEESFVGKVVRTF